VTLENQLDHPALLETVRRMFIDGHLSLADYEAQVAALVADEQAQEDGLSQRLHERGIL
jgi:hypothetical protein